MERATFVLNGTKKLDFVQFKELLDEGEKIKVEQALLKKLRQQLTMARKWRQKVKKTGLESGDATIAQLRALIPEAEGILVDLSDDMKIIKLATSKYCICRKASPDGLIVCSLCDVSFHSACLGIDSEGSASSSMFICPRCEIHRAYAECVIELLGRPAFQTRAFDTETPNTICTNNLPVNTTLPGDRGDYDARPDIDSNMSITEVLPQLDHSKESEIGIQDKVVQLSSANENVGVMASKSMECNGIIPLSSALESSMSQDSLSSVACEAMDESTLLDVKNRLLKVAKDAMYEMSNPPEVGRRASCIQRVHQMVESCGMHRDADIQ
jgi:hypothetical protein